MTQGGHQCLEWCSKNHAYAGVALFELVALSRIVVRVHVDDSLRPHAMELNYRFFSKPPKVRHALGHMHKSAGFQCFSIFFIEGAPHPDVKRTRYNSDVFILGVRVWRYLIAGWNLESERVHSLFRRIANQCGVLCTLWEHWRCRAPLQLVCRDCNMVVSGNSRY